MGNQEILNTNQAAEYLRLKAHTLKVWRYSGRGPRYIRLGVGLSSPVGYRLTDLDDWLASRTFKSTSEEIECARRGAA